MDLRQQINEALELALAAIDKETIPELQEQQPPLLQQPENLFPITAPSNNINTTLVNTTNINDSNQNSNNNKNKNSNNSKSNSNNNNNTSNNDNNINHLKEIKFATETEMRKVELREEPKHQVPAKEVFLINKTDEEKCEKLKLEENCSTILNIEEKSEEDVSKEPIYENISSTTSMMEVDVALTTTTTIITKADAETEASYQQQQQQQQQIIPSTMGKKQIDHFATTTNNDSKQLFNLQNNQNQLLLSASNQLKNSQINNFHCQISNNKSKNNNNNNGNNINNNNILSNNKSNHCNNVVELTNAFANITMATTATTTISSDLATTAHKTTKTFKENNFNHLDQPNIKNSSAIAAAATATATAAAANEGDLKSPKSLAEGGLNFSSNLKATTTTMTITTATDLNPEPYYQLPKSIEPYYDAPKHLKPVPVYENIEMFYNGDITGEISNELTGSLQPPKEKPPPPPAHSPPLFDDIDSSTHTDTWSSENTYETLTRHHHINQHLSPDHPSPPIKRMNSTKRIKKELRNKRSSFLGIEDSLMDDDESYLELTVAPPPDMAQLLQEERRLEKQLYLKAGLSDSSDAAESRDSGVSENHSRQSSEHYTNSSEENETHDDNTSPLTLQTQIGLGTPPNNMIYQNDGLLAVVPTPLLQTVKGNSAESWTESATVAAAATQSLTEATATANAKMISIEEKIREQEEVLRVERELLQFEQEELKRQRENLMLRENMARRELQHGAKMLMSANRRSLQDLHNGLEAMNVANVGGERSNNSDMYHHQINQALPNTQHITSQPQLFELQQQSQSQRKTQQIYANIPNLHQQYYNIDNDYRKSMSDINEFSKRIMSQAPAPPSKPMRTMHVNTNAGIIVGNDHADYTARQRHSLNSQSYGGSLVKIAAPPPTAAPRSGPHIYSNYQHQSVQNLSSNPSNSAQPVTNSNINQSSYPGNMSRNTLHALSATPKPKYTDGWIQVHQRKSFDSNLANDSAWLSAYQQKRKSMPDTYHGYIQNNHWLIQEAEQRRLNEQQQQQRRPISFSNTPVHTINTKLTDGTVPMTPSTNGKPLPDSIIQTLTERVQSKGIGDRKKNNMDKSPLHTASTYHQYQQQHNKFNQQPTASNGGIHRHNNIMSTTSAPTTNLTSTGTSQSHPNITTPHQKQQQPQDKVLSVSGKKKCSHCGEELGRGAAMIIESLLLFYHINCFKCCVCHVQLGDGLNGTDVRVRNHKLHCQNCYSSDDGIKFSCV